jgi:hypothetical protein
LSREESLSYHTCCSTGSRFSGLIRRTGPFIASYDTKGWHHAEDETEVLCQSMIKVIYIPFPAQKSWVPSIGLILFIGNGDMFKWVKYSLAGRKCNQTINLTNSAKFWWRVLSCKSCYCNLASESEPKKYRWKRTLCWPLVRLNKDLKNLRGIRTPGDSISENSSVFFFLCET